MPAMSEPKGRIITFWMDAPLIDAIDTRAAQDGTTRSGFVKGVLRRECETPPPEQPSQP
jgi:hypothetical protein